jgi:autotransporter-associated beta strand protein
MGTGLINSTTTSAWRPSGYNTTTSDAAALAAANTAGDYWAFQFGASSGYSVKVEGIGSGQWSTSSSGPAKMSMIYSTSSDFASYSTIATATATAGTNFNFASSFTTALLNAPITIAEGVTGFFRLVGYGGTSTTGGGTGGLVGNLTAPDFSILGTTTSLALLNWTGGAGAWANGVTANWQDAATTPTAWGAGKDATIANGGTLALEAGGITAGVVTVSGATAATFTGGALSTGSLAMTAGSTLNLNNANSAVSNAIDLTDATLSGGALSSVNGITATVSTGSKTISTALSGASGLTKSGAGELILSGANSYTGQTAVAAGTLTTSAANMLSDTATLKLDNLATFKLGGNETVGNINAAFGSTNNLQGFTLTSGGNNLSATNGALTIGAGGLVKNGSGVMYLNNSANTFSGGFTLNSGEVQYTSSGSAVGGVITNTVFGTGTLTLNGGTIGSSSSSSGRNVFNSVILNGNIQFGQTAWGTTTTNLNGGTANLTVSTNGAGTTTLAADSTINTIGSVTWDQSISGNYRITKTGTGLSSLSNNYLRLSGSNNIAGVTVNSGILGYKNKNALGTGTLILADGVTVGQDGGVLNTATADTVADRTVANNISILGNATFGLGASSSYFSGNVDLNNAIRTLTLANTTYFSGSITNGGLLVQRLDTDLASSKLLYLNGANTYNGGTTVNGVADRTNNVTLGLGNNSSLGTGSLTFAGGGTNNIRGTTLSTGDQNRTITNNIAIGSGVTVSVDTITNLVTFGTGVAVTNAVSVNMALNGVISGAGALIKTNVNTLTLGGANTYAGGTVVNGGSLAVLNTTGSGTGSGDVTVNAGSTVTGSGKISGTVRGAGLVTAGTASTATSTAMLQVGQLDTSTAMSFAFEATSTSLLTASAYNNDVISATATAGSPFTQNLTAANITSIYLNAGSLAGYDNGNAGVFQTGFFSASNFSLGSGTFNLFVQAAGGTTTYNAATYQTWAEYMTATGTALGQTYTISNTSATLANSDTGFISTVTIVPEPSTGALLAFGMGGLVLTRLLRRKQS